MSLADETEPVSHYDEIADGYARHWGPVIRPAAERVLDRIAPVVDELLVRRDAVRLLDVGTGTGTLALAALERWPGLEVTGVDPSEGMLDLARRHALDRLPADVAGRYSTVLAWADELPFPAGAFDLAVSSFVLQLVPSRAAALREIRRVLAPGGTLAWVAWQRGDRPYEPDRVANEVLDAAGFDPPEEGSGNGDIASTAAAVQGMRRAGFREVRANGDEVAHAWDATGYLAFFTEFDEASLFAELQDDERADIEREILDRLAALTAEQLTLRLPVVYALGRAAP